MSEIKTTFCLLEDRPGLWPHLGAQEGLPADIERWLNLGSACVFSNRQRALQLAERAVALARSRDSPSVLARTLYLAGVLVHQVGQPLRAYAMCLESQPMLQRLDDRWRATMVLLLRGQCCLAVDEHERARALIAEATDRFEKMADNSALAVCHQLMAMAHQLGADLASAVDSAARAAATVPPTESSGLRLRLSEQEARLRFELGQQRAREGDLEAARREFERARAALPSLDSTGPTRWSPEGARLLATMARVTQAHEGTGLSGRAVLALALWARRWSSPFERGLAWQLLAEWRRQQGRPAAATANIRRAVRHLAELPLEPLLLTAHQLLADLLEANGDLAGAYAAYCGATRIEAQQKRHGIAQRAELLMLDLEAEQELRKSEQTLAYAQRLSNVGHLLASVNHELNQPMASIRLLAETAIELIEQGELAEVGASVREMHRIGIRLADVASKLAAFPAQAETPLRSVDLQFAVEEALSTLRSRLAQTPCEIERDLPPIAVLAQEAQLVRVIANLVNNAVDVLSAQVKRCITFRCSLAADRVTLTVRDNGPGLSPGVQARLFQPFFSTKPAGQGLGLGLALSRQVMQEMGGELTARNAEGGGGAFDIVFPVAA
jgi:C4-dicarboxylate-specific signal transduction histidine kinase